MGFDFLIQIRSEKVWFHVIKHGGVHGAPANSSLELHWCEEVMSIQNIRRSWIMMSDSGSDIPINLP